MLTPLLFLCNQVLWSKIIPFENSGIPERSYLAFWYENIDGDKTC